MDVYQINFFRSDKDNRVEPEAPVSWDNFVHLFSSGHLHVESKSDAFLFNGVLYKSVDEVPVDTDDWGQDSWTGEVFAKRRKVNIKQVELLILDYDDSLTVDEAKKRFDQYEYFGYTSYNHLVKNGVHKFRLVFPLKTPLPAWVKRDELNREVEWGDWYYLREALEEFAGPCDPASFKTNQMYFVPSVHPDNSALAKVWRNPGEVLDWKSFKKTSLDRSVHSFPQKGTRPSVPRGEETLDPDYVLETRQGPIKVGDVRDKVEGVKCPFHDDKNGTEFAKRTPDGRVFLFCKRCDKTYWMDTDSEWIHPAESHKEEEQPRSRKKTKKEIKEEKRKREEAQRRLVNELLDLPQVYVDAEDRRTVLKELESIGQDILYDSGPPSPDPRPVKRKSHIVYLPEGAGKSRLAVDFAKQGRKVVFACKSWDQAFEKYDEFTKLGLQHRFSVQLFASKDAKARRRFGVPTVRAPGPDPFRTGRILDEESIEQFIAANSDLSPDFIRLSWRFFGADVLSFERIPQPIFDEDGQYVEGSEYANYVGSDVNILITTFAQLRILKLRGQYVPHEWIIWIDDPDNSDVIDIDHYDPKRWGELTDEQLEEKTIIRNGRRYFPRPYQQSLGYAYRFHKCVYTTTETVTQDAICLMLRRRKEEYVLHDKMTHLVGGKIAVLGTDKVRKRYDGVIPLVVRRLNKQGYSTILIADGLESEVNHSNNKGKNTLNDTNIVVELSIPHPDYIRTLCDALNKSFISDQHEVTRLVMLDRMHQAIGRNSGYRNKRGYECIVLADKNFHQHLVKSVRYKVDEDNSVIIDSTKAMSRKERRIKKSATSMVQELETLLNNLDGYLLDKRKSRHDINYVVKHTKEGSKRRNLIARMLLAFSSLSGVRFDSTKDSPQSVDTQSESYLDLGYWLLGTWVSKEELGSVIRDYKKEMEEIFG